MPRLSNDEQRNRKGLSAQNDPCLNPDGIYSGASKRLAYSDGAFADVSKAPKDSRKSRKG